MASLRVNILSNYAGQIWMAAMGVAFLPSYIGIMGIEAFGLVGLMLSFQSILQLLDFGVGGATNRELSRRVHDLKLTDSARDLVRTSEIVIWLLTLAAAMLIWVCSDSMADHWLHLREIDHAEATHAIVIMAGAIAVFWPSVFYANCLSGLERQPLLNLINVVFATLRYAGVLPVLLLVSPSIEAFLWWHVVVGTGQSLVTAIAVWNTLPSGRSGRWSVVELRNNRQFAGGLFAVGLLALGLTQLDRLILASLRPLEEMGYYTLALSVTAGLGRMVQPMFNALYPRFSRLVAHNDMAPLSDLYHLSSQYLAVVIAAVSAVLIVFARDVLFLWTGDAVLADKVAPTLSILALGSALNGLMNIPYALQLAYGWTRLTMGVNTVSLLLGAPLCLWAVPHYGTAGAALLWLMANGISFMIGIPLMHQRLLHGEMAAWYLKDNLPPILASLAVVLSFSFGISQLSRTLGGMALLMLVCALTLISSALASGAIRTTLFRWWSRHDVA